MWNGQYNESQWYPNEDEGHLYINFGHLDPWHASWLVVVICTFCYCWNSICWWGFREYSSVSLLLLYFQQNGYISWKNDGEGREHCNAQRPGSVVSVQVKVACVWVPIKLSFPPCHWGVNHQGCQVDNDYEEVDDFSENMIIFLSLINLPFCVRKYFTSPYLWLLRVMDMYG